MRVRELIQQLESIAKEHGDEIRCLAIDGEYMEAMDADPYIDWVAFTQSLYGPNHEPTIQKVAETVPGAVKVVVLV